MQRSNDNFQQASSRSAFRRTMSTFYISNPQQTTCVYQFFQNARFYFIDLIFTIFHIYYFSQEHTFSTCDIGAFKWVCEI